MTGFYVNNKNKKPHEIQIKPGPKWVKGPSHTLIHKYMANIFYKTRDNSSQNCVRLSNAARNDSFFSKHFFIKISVNML